MWWRKSEKRTCGNGHTLLSTWDTCPFCEDAKEVPLIASASGADEARGESGTVLIEPSPTKEPASQRRGGPVVGWIVALGGEHRGEDFRLHGGRNLVGTAVDCDVVLTDRRISRKHCVIRYEGGQFHLADLDSSNGTYVNDERVQKQELIDNDVLTLGDVRFKFKSVM